MRQLSGQGQLIEWLKALAVPMTIFGAIVAYSIGYGQLSQSEENRVTDRFEKALTRLSSKNPTERITAVTSLGLFLSDNDPEHQSYSLRALVDAMAFENEEKVAETIIETMRQIKKDTLSSDALNSAIRLVVKHNRSLTTTIIENFKKRKELHQRALLSEVGIISDKIPLLITSDIVKKLRIDDYLKLASEEHSPFQELSTDESVPLKGLANLISVLLYFGATTDDFRGIYCERCIFRFADNLSYSDFSYSFLAGSDFSKTTLRHTRFENSDIAGASFFSADLSYFIFWFLGLHSMSGHKELWGFPLLECAQLQGAHLIGFPVLTVDKYYLGTSSRMLRITLPRLDHIKYNRDTQFDLLDVQFNTSFTDEYIKSTFGEKEAISLDERLFLSLRDSFRGMYLSPTYRRNDDIFHDGSGSETTIFKFYALDKPYYDDEVAAILQSVAHFLPKNLQTIISEVGLKPKMSRAYVNALQWYPRNDVTCRETPSKPQETLIYQSHFTDIDARNEMRNKPY